TVSPVTSTTIDRLRQREDERRRLESVQVQQRSALEQWHQRELRQPPPGLTPSQLEERHRAEHRAFSDQLSRESRLFESREMMRFNHPPPAAKRPVNPNVHANAGSRTSSGYRY